MIKILVVFCIGNYFFEPGVYAQNLTNEPVFETNSIRVVTNARFPEDLESELFIGPKASPFIAVQGTKNKLKSVAIDMGQAPFSVIPSITVYPREGETNSYVLYFFNTDADGKLFTLHDLNMDGVWDVKSTPTREQKNYIFMDNHWVAVTKIGGLLSLNPKAEAPGVHYEFHDGWKVVR